MVRTDLSIRQIVRPEGEGQQFVERKAFPNSLGARDVNGRTGSGKLADALAAAATGGDEMLALTHHHDFGDAAFAGSDHGRDGAGFRTGADRIGSVLHVASSENLTVRRGDRRTHLE